MDSKRTKFNGSLKTRRRKKKIIFYAPVKLLTPKEYQAAKRREA